jgi:hypothetical protein
MKAEEECLSSMSENTNKNLWCFDSECTSHLCASKSKFTNFSENSHEAACTYGDNIKLQQICQIFCHFLSPN